MPIYGVLRSLLQSQGVNIARKWMLGLHCTTRQQNASVLVAGPKSSHWPHNTAECFLMAADAVGSEFVSKDAEGTSLSASAVGWKEGKES